MLINIRIAKAYRTVSNEALCVITGLIPINKKLRGERKVIRKCKRTRKIFRSGNGSKTQDTPRKYS